MRCNSHDLSHFRVCERDNLVRDSIVSVAALVDAALWQVSPTVHFLGAALVGAIGTALFIVTLRPPRSSASLDPV